MSYSRRKLLRDGAVSCLAGAVTSSASLLSGSQLQSQSQPKPASPMGSSFSPGIRIFFIGAWLFTPDPDDTSRILALTLDMSTPMHRFPYGSYNPSGAFDGGDDLPATGQNVKYMIHIDKPSTSDITTVFKAAATDQTFMWIPKNAKIKASFPAATRLTLRRISVPLPTRIVTANFLRGSFIKDTNSPTILYKPVSSTTGVPSAFIFDYQNATQLTTGFDSTKLTGSSTSASDYHFRVVPHRPGPANPNHPAMMFANLMSQLVDFGTSQVPTLDVSSAQGVDPGPNIPTGVSPDELGSTSTMALVELPLSSLAMNLFSLNTASCAGGGGGIHQAP